MICHREEKIKVLDKNSFPLETLNTMKKTYMKY